MWIKFIFTVFIFSFSFLTPVFSQPVKVLDNIPIGNCASLEDEKTKYFKENKYSEFIDFLNNYKITDKLHKSCINYYKALSRYTQLSYLEEKQSWDEYFANGNIYREEIVDNVNIVIAQTNPSDGLRSKSRLLIWQFHRGQQDAFSEQALLDLITDLKAYAGSSKDTALIKQIADALLSNGEKIKARELYKLYVDKLGQEKMTDLELKNIAAGFYKEKNLQLAQTVYDIYIEKVSKSLAPDKFIQELFELANLFVYGPEGNGLASDSQSHGPQGNASLPARQGLTSDLYDMDYAEKIYKRIEELGQNKAFDQEQMYLRAFNLEKMKEYKRAKEIYLQLIQLYADTKHFDAANYKIAMIDAYVLADIPEAKSYFEKLAAKLPSTPEVISSLYQLGLISQWEGNLDKAKDYYSVLIKNSKDSQNSTAAFALARLKEIEENKPLDYNLKTFLDLSFKDASSSLELGRSELVANQYILEKGQKITVSSLVNMPESGCNQVELQYLWSGNLGSAATVSSPSFECSYSDLGTKEINMVTVSATGVIDRAFIMVDVY